MVKKSKKEVHYSTGTPAEHCGNCSHFLRPRACERVEGEIRARDWCDEWSPQGEAARQRAA